MEWVALKVLPPNFVGDDERRRRFVQEAQLASSLQHPNIVTIFDIGTAGDTDYLAMELVRGRTLEEVIPEKGLRLPEALRYAIQITDALAAAHAAGIIHRDLKPSNMMVTDQGQIKIGKPARWRERIREVDVRRRVQQGAEPVGHGGDGTRRV